MTPIESSPINRFKYFFLWILTIYPSSSMAADVFDLGQVAFRQVEAHQQNVRLPAQIITALIEGPTGLIYFGTQNTLFVYDGYQAQPLSYLHKGKMISDTLGWVDGIERSSIGEIWISTVDRGAVQYNPFTKKATFYRPDATNSNSISRVRVNGISFEGDKGVYFATPGGLDHLDLASGDFKHQQLNLPGHEAQSISRIIHDNSNTHWAGLRNGGLAFKREGETQWIRFNGEGKAASKLDNVTASFLFVDSRNALWLATYRKGLFKIQNGKVTQADLPNVKVRGLMELESGKIWASVKNNGIYLLDHKSGRQLKHYSHEPGVTQTLPIDDIHPLMRDKSGLLWVGTRGAGIYQVNGDNRAHRFLYASTKHTKGLSDNNAWTSLVRRNGDLWISFLSKGIDVLSAPNGITQKHNINLPSGTRNDASGLAAAATWMVEDRQNKVWVGSAIGGIQYYDDQNNRFVSLQGQDGVRDVRHALLTADDKILTLSKRPSRYDAQTALWQAIEIDYSNTTGIPLLLRAAIDAEGAVWASSITAIVKIPRGSQRGYLLNLVDEGMNPLQLERFTQIFSDKDGRIYITTKDKLYGVKRTINNEKAVLTPIIKAGLTDNARLYIAEGKVWSMFDSVDLNSKTIEHFDLAYGQAVEETWNYGASITAEQTMVFLSPTVINLFKPERLVPWDYMPATVIRTINIDDKHIVVNGEALTIKPDQSRISVTFASLDYSSPMQNRYRYRLHGNDKDWIETDARQRHATYTNLQPGEYKLEINGSNRLGQWSPNSTNLVIDVIPAWYQTAWFRVVVGLGFGLLLYGIYYLRVRSLQLRQRVLTLLVDERTQELKETRDKLVAVEKHIALGRLVRGMAHEINTPLSVVKLSFSVFVETVKKLLAEVTSATPSDHVKQKLDEKLGASMHMVESNIEKTNRLITSFKKVAVDTSELRQSDFNLLRLIEAAVTLEANEAEGERLSLDIKCDAKLEISSYANIIQDVLVELLANIRNYGQPSSAKSNDETIGAIEVRLSAEKNEQVPRLHITVSDHGRGIAPDLINKVFDPFFTTAGGAGSSGLGLHLVFNYVSQLLKGEVSSDLTSEGGFVIHIHFPIKLKESK